MPRRRAISGFQRKDKGWSFYAGGNIAFTVNNTIAAGGSFATTESITVMRLLGEYIIVPTSAPSAGDMARISIGIGKLSDDAVAASTLPEPDDEGNFPWLYFASHPFFFGTTSADPSSAGASVRVRFDIKSMRKLKARESLVTVLQYVDVAGAPPLTVHSGVTRVLVAE